MRIEWHMPILRSRGCGLSRRALCLAAELQRLGHTVRFVVDVDKTDVAAETIGGIETIDGMPLKRIRVARPNPLHWSLQSMARTSNARAIVREIGQDHDLLVSGQPEVVAAYAGLPDRKPVVFVCGGSTLLHDSANIAEQATRSFVRRVPFALDRALKHKAESGAFASANANVFDSLHTRDRVVADYGICGDRCHTVYGGVDEDIFFPAGLAAKQNARQGLGIAEDAFVVTWTGRLSPEKNVGLLIRSVAACRQRPDRVLLVGDGPDRTQLERLVCDLGLDECILFLGEHGDVRPFLHAADVFAFPSRGESFGGALIEAMACGLACVALRSNGCDVRTATGEILQHGSSGLVVETTEPAAFARALDCVGEDEATRKRLGEGARRRACEMFTWRCGGERLNAVIQAVAGKTSQAGVGLTGDRESPTFHLETSR